MSEREPQKTEDLDVDVGGIDEDAGLDGTSDVGLDESSEFGDSVDDGGLAGLDESGGMGAEREPKQSEESSGGILRTLYGRTLGRVLSTRSLGISIGLTLVFSLLFGLIPLLGIVGKLLGVGVAGFVYGLLASDDRYLETGVAGGLIGGLSAFLGNLLLVSMGSTTRLLAIGTIGGLILALFGHYFGRDMRDGLTRDV